MNTRSRAAIALAVAVALLLALSVVAEAARMRASRQAATGAGKMPTARASSASDEAWVYTSRFRTSMPTQTTGSIQIIAIKGAKMAQDKADVAARFAWKNATYTLRVTCLFPIAGQDFPGHGPVQFMRQVLGTTDLGTLGLPETHAHVAVYGRSTIYKNGKMLVDGQPTIVLVTQAIHGSDQHLLASPTEDRSEIQLIVPGPLDGQRFVKGFPNGYVYVYWPNVKLTTSGNVKPYPATSTPSRIGRGPVAPILGTHEPRGTIDISLTDRGVVKKVGQAPFGLYDLHITNNSSRPRGLTIRGADLCCTFYTRFSQVLRPGGKQVFRWFFAPGKVQIRDFLGGRKTRTAYTNVRYGRHSSSFVFE